MSYMKHLVKEATDRGYTAVVFNSRGMNSELKTPKVFNGADLTDLDAALKFVRD